MRRSLLPLAGLAVLACAGDGGPDEVPEGELATSELHVVGTSDLLAIVEDLTVLEDGTVWVQNSVEPLFLAFDGSGGPTAEHGRRGGGPEEFGAPAGFVAAGLDGDAWVLDRRRNVLVRVSTPDLPRAEVGLPGEVFPVASVLGGMSLMSPLVRTARLGNAVVLPRRRGVGEVSAVAYYRTIWDADLVAFDPATGGVSTVVPLPEALGDIGAHFTEVGAGFPPFPFWYRLWTACGEAVWLHDLVRNQLRGFTADGTELEPVQLPPPAFTEVSPREFVRAAFDLIAAERVGAVSTGVGLMSSADSARLIQGAVAALEGSEEQHAAVLPQYVDLRCGEGEGVLWLQPLDLEAGGMRGSATWLRVSPDHTLARVDFPDRFQPYVFRSGQAWGITRDALDVATVARVDLP
ncbi:MAG TPA: hypothetical protein VK858_18105 [Longimicrobiales bacterium]|nr:hypothetical protein [Longimicrobiales bacterium]